MPPNLDTDAIGVVEALGDASSGPDDPDDFDELDRLIALPDVYATDDDSDGEPLDLPSADVQERENPPRVPFHVFASVALGALRRQRDIHLHVVARAMGLSDAQWSRVESGRSVPTPNHVECFVRLLGDAAISVGGIYTIAEGIRAHAFATRVGAGGVRPLAAPALNPQDNGDKLTRAELAQLRTIASEIVAAFAPFHGAPSDEGVEL